MTRQLFLHASLTGLLLALAGPPVCFGPLILLAWIPLFRGLLNSWQQSRLTWKAAFLAGVCAGLPLYLLFTSWLLPQAPGKGVLLALGLSLPLGLAGLGIRLGLGAGLHGSGLALWLTSLLASFELVLGWSSWLPSCASGYALWHVPMLIQSAEFAGVFGVSFWVLGVNALIACLWQYGMRCCPIWAVGVAILSVALIAHGAWCLNAFELGSSTQEALQVALVQTTVDTDRKLEREVIEATSETLVRLTGDMADQTSDPLDLVVWPETSVPVFLRAVEERALLQALTRCARDTQVPLLVGSLAATQESERESTSVHNAVLLIPPDGFVSQEYHKCNLVPFYEDDPLQGYLPESWRRSRSGSLTAGQEPGLFSLGEGIRFGVVICWEALASANVARLAAGDADFLVNMTNDDAAFGSRRWPYQLPLPHVFFRAVETRRPLLRCANRGLSLAVDRAGRLVSVLPWGQEHVTTVAIVPGRGQTVFTRVGRLPAVLVSLLAAIWGLVLVVRCVRARIGKA